MGSAQNESKNVQLLFLRLLRQRRKCLAFCLGVTGLTSPPIGQALADDAGDGLPSAHATIRQARLDIVADLAQLGGELYSAAADLIDRSDTSPEALTAKDVLLSAVKRVLPGPEKEQGSATRDNALVPGRGIDATLRNTQHFQRGVQPPKMAENLRIKRLDVESLVPYARNDRIHSVAQVAQIAASIEEFGWTNPILAEASGSVIAGAARLEAARAPGRVRPEVLRRDSAPLAGPDGAPSPAARRWRRIRRSGTQGSGSPGAHMMFRMASAISRNPDKEFKVKPPPLEVSYEE